MGSGVRRRSAARMRRRRQVASTEARANGTDRPIRCRQRALDGWLDIVRAVIVLGLFDQLCNGRECPNGAVDLAAANRRQPTKPGDNGASCARRVADGFAGMA